MSCGPIDVATGNVPPLNRREVYEDVGEPVTLEGLRSPVDHTRAFVEDYIPGLLPTVYGGDKQNSSVAGGTRRLKRDSTARAEVQRLARPDRTIYSRRFGHAHVSKPFDASAPIAKAARFSSKRSAKGAAANMQYQLSPGTVGITAEKRPHRETCGFTHRRTAVLRRYSSRAHAHTHTHTKRTNDG